MFAIVKRGTVLFIIIIQIFFLQRKYQCNAFDTKYVTILPHQRINQPSFTPTEAVIRQRTSPNLGYSTFRRCVPSTTGTLLASSNVQLMSSSSSSLLYSSIAVRSVYIRALAFVYMISFLIAYIQNTSLIGDHGITPAKHVLDNAQQRGTLKRQLRLQWRIDGVDRITNKTNTLKKKSGWRKYLTTPIFQHLNIRPLHWFSRMIDSNPTLLKVREICWDRTDSVDRPVTTLLWLANERQRNHLNIWLNSIAMSGLVVSLIMTVIGAANVPCILTVYILHRSLMAVGGPFYGFGWEPQLAELGFHTLFLVPLWSLNPFYPLQIPATVRWCIQWHLFRVMIGAGLIKLRSSDEKWKKLTAMNYFYETQPIPNPLSRYFHWMPPLWHNIEVLINHFVELIAPWLLIIPGLPVPLRRAGGMIQLIFQTVLIASGNLSFLNWMTMVPALMCLDDALLFRFLSPMKRDVLIKASKSSWMYISMTREVIGISLLLLVLTLSRPVVKNLLSSNQVMNRSYDPLRLINTYGAFGTVKEDRDEYIISSACKWDGEWREYEFKAKPGNIYRAPRFLSPYHYRLDWQMWIAASFGRIENSPWMYSFLAKLLQQDQQILNILMKGDPWMDSTDTPRYIRVQLYRYRFHKRSTNDTDSPYWDRELVRNVYPQNGLATESSLLSMCPPSE